MHALRPVERVMINNTLSFVTAVFLVFLAFECGFNCVIVADVGAYSAVGVYVFVTKAC